MTVVERVAVASRLILVLYFSSILGEYIIFSPLSQFFVLRCVFAYIVNDIQGLTMLLNCGAGSLCGLPKKRSWVNGRYLSSKWDIEEKESKRGGLVEGDKLVIRWSF